MDVTAKKTVVTDFLVRCNAYADGELARYRRALEGATADEAQALEAKIGQWTAYRAFNEHALREVAAGELDDWFA